ncbi:photosystem I reaction center subunit PsaK [Roseofilum sp. BLCC_M91]|uniref:Photosystem I reaction center subunit PsaK n=1 Tax=Roseofilum halophilum BLCC-M91 TaxID=3022259 RepID=A0ABT7BI19_9CYAN|nr:photosystem I reaction center subunit PsaK [Roseofilum halophilum]MDJ1177908.1 photosystem I reaction center subunit PsaK [Roseofilum halophilum BLCC-M91]
MTSEWSLNIGLIMIACNILAIAIGKFTIQQKGVGPGLPAGPFFGGMGMSELLATTSLGHILGAGVILGLSGTGAI